MSLPDPAPLVDGPVAEWEPQGGVLMTWPHAASDWGADLAEAEACFARIAAAISLREPVLLACQDAEVARRARAAIVAADGDPGRLRCYPAPSDDCWARDHGPVPVRRGGGPVLLDFRFDGWGGKYPAARDDRITATLHARGAFGRTPLERVDWVLEGGSIDADGAGAVLTTTSCLVTAGRNPGHDRAAVEAALRRWLGVRRVLWLDHGAIPGDDTDGHVDTLARFCAPDTIAYQACEDATEPAAAGLRAMAAELAALRDAAGRPYRLVPLPWPRPVRDAGGRRLPATYANFLVIDGAVLVPGYNDPADEPARRALAACFPGRAAVQVDCRALIRQSGSLHCVTRELPAGSVPAAEGGAA